MAKNTSLSTLFIDLEIDPKLLRTDPKKFVELMDEKGKWLQTQLDLPDSIVDKERSFKERSAKNSSAVTEAEELFSKIENLILDAKPEVIANLLSRFKELEDTVKNQVTGYALRSSLTPGDLPFTKKHIHMMYCSFRDAQEVIKNYCDTVIPEEKIKVKMVPARSGNYNSNTSGVKTYRFAVRPSDGGDWITYENPYAVAKLLGVKVKFFGDLPEIIESADNVMNGYEVKMLEV